MKGFRIIPNFSFVIFADDYETAEKIAYDRVNEMCAIVGVDFDLYIHEDFEGCDGKG